MTAQELALQFDLDINLANLLHIRGIDTNDKASKFLNPCIDNITKIELYKGAISVAERINNAINNKESILIYGDYDCDGICSVAMLYLYLISRNATVSYYIPARHTDGYGINIDAVSRLKQEYSPDVIITVDCGISAYKEIDFIKNKFGIEVIVTDHHNPPSILPNALIFNPKCEGGFQELSGAGVVLRLIEAMSDREEMLKYIDIAAIATIADIVPLVDDNRVITALGLKALKSSPRRGLKILKDIAKCDYKASDIAFKIAPRINATGRLSDATKVVQLFISDDHFLLHSIAREIDNDNNDRRLLSEKTYQEALIMLEDYDLINNQFIVLSSKEWDIGVLGIAAAKIAREFNRPTMLLTLTNGYHKGSGRSVKGINLYNIMLTYKDNYHSFGGHSQAIGVSFTENYLEEFVKSINSQQVEQFEIPCTDNTIELGAIEFKLFKDLERLEPFGCGNNKPKFTYNKSNLSFGIISNTSHIKAKFNKDIEFVGFNLDSHIHLLNSDLEYKLTLDLNINKYNGHGQGIINSLEYIPKCEKDEYLQACYLKQLLYNDECTRRVINIDSIEKLEINSNYGTLIIASEINTCYNVMSKCNNILEFAIIDKATFNPVNCLIIAPNSVNVTKYYNRVVFVDKPLQSGYIDRFNYNKDAEIYVVNLDTNKSFNVNVDNEKLQTAYKVIKGLLLKTKPRNINALYDIVSKKYYVKYLDFMATFYILYELKALVVDSKFNIITNDLELDINSSKIYGRLNEH